MKMNIWSELSKLLQQVDYEYMVFSRNIKLLRLRRGRSQQEVAESIGTTRSSLSGYENETAQPPFHLLIKLSDYYKISLDKLLRVDLSAVSESQLGELERSFDFDLTGKKLRVMTTAINEDGDDMIELVPEKAKAGYTTGYSDPGYIESLPMFRLPFLTKNRKFRAFQISGDSMPPVEEGAWVIGQYIDDWRDVKDGVAYIIATKNEGVVFKVAYNRIDSDRSLLLCSSNTFYQPFEVPVEEILEVWKFTNYISSKFQPNS